MTEISVIGGGAWGTALAASLARAGRAPKLWARDPAVVADICERHQNRRFLGDIALPETIHATVDQTEIAPADVVLAVIPTQTMRDALTSFATIIKPDAALVLCAKGIESTTGKRVSEIARDILPHNPLAVLSGPSFAHDVAQGLPTAVTLAADTLDGAASLAKAIASPTLRLYASDDIIGVELGGALKNVIALAIGMARAKKLGASAEAALTTRGFAELSRIARHYDAKPKTLMGLSCLGDLMLTCSSPQSRNFAYGMAVGRGDDLSRMKLAEGVHTTKIATELCVRAGIDAPIIAAINAVLSGKLDINEAMNLLLSRPLKSELV